ncbi:putative glycoside hydrolase [Cohnella thermotolerans]|uniref:putative glycoside hydrolase n=1 Tax=Cohnella thermotolerans TaxID=329858 RepID=UPI0006873010|nr:putative glycoside hydrolase [Cohnella thermotolerans]
MGFGKRRRRIVIVAKLMLSSVVALVAGCVPYDRNFPSRWTAAPYAEPCVHAVGSGARLPLFPVRGIYVSSHAALSPKMNKLIRLVHTTELNAMVIDVNSGVSLIDMPPRKLAASRSASAAELRRLIKRLKRQHIYLIARVVTFKNAQLAESNPAWAMKRSDGSIWRDAKGTAWIDPYRREAWEYPIALAVEAARIGFDEVQFDYVRFPENPLKVQQEVRFRNPERLRRDEVIRQFLHTAALRVHRAGAVVSVDVFGLVGSSRTDMGIGQTWKAIASEVDVISPMVYPSHYSPGIWGIRQPDLMPGAVVSHALKDAMRRNRTLRSAGRPAAQVRPWLQSFTASWVHPHRRYGPAEIREQVQAASRLGIQSYLLWNSSAQYPFEIAASNPSETPGVCMFCALTAPYASAKIAYNPSETNR